jgi:hypothetical protein
MKEVRMGREGRTEKDLAGAMRQISGRSSGFEVRQRERQSRGQSGGL